MRRVSDWIVPALFFAGLSLIVSAILRSLFYQEHLKESISQYREQVGQTEDSWLKTLWEAAVQYNQKLFDGQRQSDAYSKLLKLRADGLMCYLEIPAIEMYLPVYHGTSAQTLQKGAGHLEQSSLPVGGQSAHCVISAHSGMPGKVLFDHLDRLKAGDVFYLHTLDQTLAYEVDRIRTVLPYELEDLKITGDGDYVTLLTCTPYGVNTHRLLVRGRRIAGQTVPKEKIQENTRQEKTGVLQEIFLITITGSAVFCPSFLMISRRFQKQKQWLLRKQSVYYRRKVCQYVYRQKGKPKKKKEAVSGFYSASSLDQQDKRSLCFGRRDRCMRYYDRDGLSRGPGRKTGGV